MTRRIGVWHGERVGAIQAIKGLRSAVACRDTIHSSICLARMENKLGRRQLHRIRSVGVANEPQLQKGICFKPAFARRWRSAGISAVAKYPQSPWLIRRNRYGLAGREQEKASVRREKQPNPPWKRAKETGFAAGRAWRASLSTSARLPAVKLHGCTDRCGSLDPRGRAESSRAGPNGVDKKLYVDFGAYAMLPKHFILESRFRAQLAVLHR